MKPTKYKDYRKASEYFTDENEELLSEEINAAEKQKKFIVWVQEFSKKIVVVIFIFYILSSLASIVLVYLSYLQGMMSGIDTLIAENNSTFREIVGGYIIKAAIENAVKIAGNYYIGITDARLKALKQGLVDKGFKIKNKSETPVESVDFTYEETSGGDTTL